MMSQEAETFLDRLVAATVEEQEKRERNSPLRFLQEAIASRQPPRGFVGAIGGPPMRLIAEIKRASPSKGDLNTSLDPVALARTYESAGANAISVLTEPRFFKGSLADLAAVSSQVAIPVLRKDFILSPYQIHEARAFGADAVLLIAAILSGERLRALVDTARGLGLGVLIEVHDRAELSRVLESVDLLAARGQGIALGINNRNLKDFGVDLETTLDLRSAVPGGITLVSESGIRTREDVIKLETAGVDAILVGEALVSSEDASGRITCLLGR